MCLSIKCPSILYDKGRKRFFSLFFGDTFPSVPRCELITIYLQQQKKGNTKESETLLKSENNILQFGIPRLVCT